ncbi:MAG: Ig-like domain-containing protein [Burkholderiales bacterium]|nr:Ig-like domain-containing protein [Burkholderiales bacterium]
MSVQLMRGIRYLGGDMFRVVRALMAWLLIASIGILSACGGGSGTTFGGAPSGGGDTTQAPTIALTLSGTTTSSTAPITAIATVLTATGTPVPGVVVSFSSTSGLGSPSVPTALTNALGQASVTLFPALGVTVGADLLNARATVNSTQIATAQGFQVVPSLSASGLTLSLSSDTVTATAEVTVNALARDAAGAPVAGQVVNFTTGAGLGVLSAPSALSDATGTATVKLTPKPGVTVGADFVTATTSIASVNLSASRGFQIAGGVASSSGISVVISSATVTDASPATVTATVKDSVGQPAKQQVVSFSTSGIGALSAPTALTNADGVASVTIRPAAGAPSGAADSVVASVNLAGLNFQAQQSFQLGGTSATSPHLAVELSTASVTSAVPATVTVTLTDGSAQPVPGQVVTLATASGFGVLSAASVLTDSVGKAQVLLFAKAGLTSGADILSAGASVSGVSVVGQIGFEVAGATAVIATFTSDVAPLTSLSAYGQTNLTGTVTGLAIGTPVGLNVSSTCVAKGKATITPASLTTTSGNASFTYRDNGCGATDSKDDISLSIVGTTVARSLSFPIAAPSVGSITFSSAIPDKIFLRGSGFTETSVVTFSVLDLAGNPLPNQDVDLQLTTVAGGLTIDGQSGLLVTKRSDANGKVAVLVNSGTVPTPVRVQATLKGLTPVVGTVSSTLAIAVGLPSQLNFSLSQGTKNIEGADLDGTTNTYVVIASDRLANPVPNGTAVNFVAEGGSIESIKQVVLPSADGISRVIANFVSASPRPANGRITVVAYALGEEPFLDKKRE